MNQRFGLEVNNSDCKQAEAAGDNSTAKVVVVIDTSFKQQDLNTQEEVNSEGEGVEVGGLNLDKLKVIAEVFH